MTLKQVATRCGMSATHISEVERGRTSPTIGALQRIAAALDEKPSYFVREDVLEPVTFTPASKRCDYFSSGVDGTPLAVDIVSKGIPGGYVQVVHKRGQPGQHHEGVPRIGEMFLLCLHGMARVTVGDESWVLREGDALQTRLDRGFRAEVIGEEDCEALWVIATPVLLPI